MAREWRTDWRCQFLESRRLERIWWWQAVSADCAAMAASASRARCVLGERKRLACGTGVVAWRARLAEGTKGISPRALRVPAPSSDFRLGEAEEERHRRGMTGGFHSSVRQEETYGVLAGPAHARTGASGVRSRLSRELGQLAELGQLVLGRCCAAWAGLAGRLGRPAW
jgi:hypothetical protein